MSTNERVHKSVVRAFQQELIDCGCSSAVVYFDGNPASVLAASLAIDAVGADHVICVTTTDVGSMSVSRAVRAAKSLEVSHQVIPIVVPVASIISQIEYSGIKLTNGACITGINRRVTSAVIQAIAEQIGARAISPACWVSGYDPLGGLAESELISLYEYYDISLTTD